MRPSPPSLSVTPPEPGLYVVSTPIGNLRDISLRALDILSACDLILAEDTRVAKRLLSVYGLSRPVERYDDHSDAQVRPRALALLRSGRRIALISDAGTPLVSDPGYRLVKAVADEDLPVFAAPGASAVLAALAVSGLPSDRFLFAGFTPARPAARRELLEELSPIRATLIFYETGPRLTASLKDMLRTFGDRPAVIARELTKLYESVLRGSLSELIGSLDGRELKGEIVVLISAEGERSPPAANLDQSLMDALSHHSPSEAAALVAKALCMNRKTVYRRALELKGSGDQSG